MNCVKKLGLLLVTLVVMAALTGAASAEPAAKEGVAATVKTYPNAFSTPAWGAGVGAGLVIIGASVGFGKIGAAALESMARQPETAGRVQTAMIIIAALLEGVTFFALVICFMAGQAA